MLAMLLSLLLTLLGFPTAKIAATKLAQKWDGLHVGICSKPAVVTTMFLNLLNASRHRNVSDVHNFTLISDALQLAVDVSAARLLNMLY